MAAPGQLVGKVLNGTYEVKRLIGEGGMGAIYEVHHTRLAGKKFALKTLHAALVSNQEVYLRFRREAEIASGLGNDHIVDVYDFNTSEDNVSYMVMELLDGHDLSDRIRQTGPMPLSVAAGIIAQSCNGLQAAHDAGIVHRDLKPPNIFLCNKMGRDDFVKILDFGVSKVHDSSSVITRDQTLMGTPNYMSPEQADGLNSEIDARTDVFAFGAIVWEMLTGKIAFEAPTISGTIYQVVHVNPPEVHTVRGDVPPAVSQVLGRALAKNKHERFERITEFGAALARAMDVSQPAIPIPHQGQGYAATVMPHTPVPQTQMAPHTPVPQTRLPSHGDVPQTGVPHTGAPQTGVPQTGVPHTPPISTLSGAASAGTTPPQGKSGKGGLIAGLAILLIGGGAGAAYVATDGFGSGGGGGDAADAGAIVATIDASALAATPDAAPIAAAPPDAAPIAVAPPDAAAIKRPPPKQTVTIRFSVTPPRARKGMRARLDGEPLRQKSIELPKSDRKMTLQVKPAKGFKPTTVTFRPDRDKTVTVRCQPDWD